MKNIITYLVLSSLILATTSAPAEEEVKALDGYIDFTGKFQMYSGYLTVQQQPLLNIHYLLVTSQSAAPQNDPLVVWLNGGPGCSSLLGFASQNGPNIMWSGSQKFEQYINKYAWNQNANILYLESPPGVGFSVNNDPNFNYTEASTAWATYQALLSFFMKFPQYKPNQFWITGESYCGMYIPFLADKIVTANKAAPADLQINLKGIMIGNGVMITNKHWRRLARNQFYAHHRFYGPEIDRLLESCTYTDKDSFVPSCVQGNRLADQAVDTVNPYATISVCYGADGAINRNRKRYWYAPFFQQNNQVGTSGSPCTDDVGMTAYFNKDVVKQQLHIDATITWASCNENIGNVYQKEPTSIPIFQNLKKNNIRIMLYSGNTDAVVSYIESQKYIGDIGWKQTVEKVAIQNPQASLIGWRTVYDGLTYYVINGAGHMVPADKPYAGWFIFNEFLNANSEQMI